MPIKQEFRTTGQVEKSAGASTKKISGYAARFNSPTVIAGLFREQVAPGAFDQSIKVDDIRALFNHIPSDVLGRTKAGTLSLVEDDNGLRFEITPSDAQWVRDLMSAIDRGDISQCSFGFTVTAEDWTMHDNDELPLRTLIEVRLSEISPVTYPAYEDTSVALRARELSAGGSDTDVERRPQEFGQAIQRRGGKRKVFVEGRPFDHSGISFNPVAFAKTLIRRKSKQRAAASGGPHQEIIARMRMRIATAEAKLAYARLHDRAPTSDWRLGRA